MPLENPSSTELCELLLNTGEPTIWAEMHAALMAVARRHGLVEAEPDDAWPTIQPGASAEPGWQHPLLTDPTT